MRGAKRIRVGRRAAGGEKRSNAQRYTNYSIPKRVEPNMAVFDGTNIVRGAGGARLKNSLTANLEELFKILSGEQFLFLVVRGMEGSVDTLRYMVERECGQVKMELTGEEIEEAEKQVKELKERLFDKFVKSKGDKWRKDYEADMGNNNE